MSEKITDLRVEYSKGLTINLGDFNNIKPEISVSGRVPEGMHPTDAKNKLKALVDAWLEQEVIEVNEDRK